MAQQPSFDIVSKVEMPEVQNAVQQAVKEIGQRYDFKDSKTSLDLNMKDSEIVLQTEDDYKLKAAADVLQSKLHRRGVSLKNLEFGTAEAASGNTLRQKIKILQGIQQEKAKAIVAAIKDSKIKVQAAIQGDTVRVSGKNIDDLQSAIQLLKGKDFGLELQFENYRK